ncbi:MAG: coproporphyrinogen III oxidase, partial [Gemmobacter sp.]|nr:coproporphyrinogen III oxidase [Gemmobacter sp.]
TDLRRLGRKHDLAEARRAIDIAQATFDRVSFDLIYARQYQSLSDWERELAEALRITTGHLSLYQLTVEDGTVFGERFARGQLRGLPSEDLAADFFDLTQTMCTDAGLPAYEISNHARPGQESRHNRIYWTGGDYAGIGPGAHGRLTYGRQRHATAAIAQPADWLAEAASTEGVQDSPAALSSQEQAIEYLLMGLRLRDGIRLSRLAGFTGRDLAGSRLAGLRDLGMVQQSDDRLSVTDRGRPLLNAILAELTADI